MRGRDHPDIDANRGLTADTIKLTLSQYAQQPRLQGSGHVPDLIEEQRATVGLLEPATTLSVRPRERALLVPEQLGLEKIGGNGRGVQGDEGLSRARAVIVQSARNQLLARAGLAGDQDGHAGSGKASDRAEDLLHGRCAAQQFRNLGRRRITAALATLGVGDRRAPDQGDRLIDVERLRQIFERAAFVGGYRASEVGMRRHDDDRQRGPGIADLLQQLQARLARHADIGEQDIRGFTAERLQRRLSGFECTRRHAAVAQSPLQYPTDGGIVVDEPDA